MNLSRFAASTAVLSIVFVTSFAAQQGPPAPKPGPEQAVLKMDEGTWDAVIEIIGPDGKSTSTKGVEVNKMGCGGMCLITDFKGEMMGAPFVGHGVAAWDPAKKKYVISWSDSMGPGVSTGESTWDAAAKKSSGWMESTDPTGKPAKMRSVVEYKGSTRVMTMFAPGPDGKEAQLFKITYTRRKT
jgi:hypothetical protein